MEGTVNVLLILVSIVSVVYGVIAWNAVHMNQDRLRTMRVKWEDCVKDRCAEESLIFEWSCRDLMPEWEQLYPHVQNMNDQRKYSEWATFCANYPTRESIMAHLDLEL